MQTPSSAPTTSELGTVIAALRPVFLRAAGFSLIASLLVLAPTGYMLEVYDRVLNSRNFNTLAMLTLLVLGAYAVMVVLEWARAGLMQAAGLAFDRAMSERIFNAIFEANLQRAPGGTLQPMNDLRALREFAIAPVLMALVEAPVALVFLALIFAISPVLGWSALLGAAAQTLLAWLTERGTQPPLMAASRSAMAAQQYADGALRNAEVMESMGMLPHIHRRWIAKQNEFLSLQAQASEAAAGFQAVSKFVQQVMGSLLLGLGAWLLLRNELNGGAGMMIMGSILGGRVLAPLVQIVSQWRTLVTVRAAWARVETLLSRIPPATARMVLPPPTGQLAVENLIAGSPNSTTMILRGLQFSLQRGEVLVVVGQSGSGKTTLARLLAGVWPATSGKVRLDGADIFNWDKTELGPHVGYLPQGVALFDGNVAQNIARFGELDTAKIEVATRAVGLHEFILELPQGYNTPVGRDGAMLSGGQRQRIALARAIYGQPVFVVLDEPNSSLDEAGDAALALAITTLKQQGTTFVVMTHRTSVLAVADKLLVLHEGTQQAFGPRDEVMAALAKANQAATISTKVAAS